MVSEATSFVSLKDQIPVSDEEFNLISSIRDQIEILVSVRDRYIQRNGLDPEVYNPGGNWTLDESQHLIKAYRTVMAADKEFFNKFRLVCCIYPGHSILPVEEVQKQFPSFSTVEAVLDNTDLHTVPRDILLRYQKLASALMRYARISTPLKFGELGWIVEDQLVNAETCDYLETLYLLFQTGAFYNALNTGQKMNILEIRAGYGALAYHIKQVFPNSDYYIVDLPESLLFSSIYLSLLMPSPRNNIASAYSSLEALKDEHCGFMFIPNYMFQRLRACDLHFDLVVNTISLGEMTEEQVRAYCSGISQLIGTSGEFVEHNDIWTEHLSTELKPVVAPYFDYCREFDFDFSLFHDPRKIAHLWANRLVAG